MNLYDYIVIGAGSSGGMLAYRMSEDINCRVLLLEAGGKEGHWSIRMPVASRNNYTGGPRNWCFETEPEPHMNNRRLFQPRGKVIGGSSSLNGMVYVRGHRKDFDNWQASGAEGWGYTDVLPYFKSMERCDFGSAESRGKNGSIVVERLTASHPIEQAFLDAGVQAGYAAPDDYNGQEQEGMTCFDANIDGGNRSATAALISTIRQRPNLQIETNAHVTSVVIKNGAAVGVEYLQNGKTLRSFCEGEVILSAGAFQSPQLLMLSGIGPAAQLQKQGINPLVDLPGVGENLHDHLEVHIKHRCPPGMSKNKLLSAHRMALMGLQWFLFRSGDAATTQSRVGAFLKTDETVDYPNMQYHFWPYFLEGWSPPPDKDGYCFDAGPVRTSSRGWVRLRSSDPLDSPKILLNALSTERDMQEFRDCIRITRELAGQPAFDFCRGPEVFPGPEIDSDQQIDDFIRNNANSAYHPGGTCKMGVDDMAVVDPKLRVYGVDKLRVADASIMPVIPNGNINAPCLMIGERARDLLLDV